MLATLLLLGCGGGGGGGGPTSPTAPPEPVPATGISFSPAVPDGAAVALRGDASETTLEVEIYATEVEDLYGLSFEFWFPADLLRYESHVEGVFPGLETRETAAGRLLVGATHFGAVAGVSGEGAIVVLRFTAVASGDGRFDFDDEQAFDSFGESLALSWHGGTVRVVL